MKIINTEKHVIKSWCENPEEGALAQARNLANLPFIYKQVCLMPDTHQGYGMPIGGVIGCENVIIPNAVGVDIGCGVLSVKTDLTEIGLDIRKAVPTGFKHHIMNQVHPEDFLHQILSVDSMEIISEISGQEYFVVYREAQSATYQLGTLGGGNHFIEIQKGSDGFIYAMLHSGSRNIGKQVADHYNKLAVEINQQYFSTVPKEWQLAFLPLHSIEGSLYRVEMQACLNFARWNRRMMMNRIKEIINENLMGLVSFDTDIDIHHNYATMENHFGRNLMIHRKGATSAREGEIGLIPGSQGTCSYIVRGKGYPESFMSCSHGAGRSMGRKEAQRTLNLEEEIARMDAKGIIHDIRTVEDLDEAASAYKDIDTVMSEQADLVEILIKLEPLAVIKGD
jgi:tRNA-splicing ligase RtcB